jgi:hypothetical protein
MKLFFEKLSAGRRLTLTIAGLLYAMAILGNVYYHMSLLGLLGATLFFLVITGILLLWIK